jgi:putative transposase
MIQRQRAQNGVIMLITMNTWHRRQVFIHPNFAEKAIDYLYALQKKHDFSIYGFVVMPDHIHLLLKIQAPYTVDEFTADYRTGLSFELGTGAFFEEYVDLRMPQKPQEKLQYMHDKPFEAELAATPKDYPWSSAGGTWKTTQIS